MSKRIGLGTSVVLLLTFPCSAGKNVPTKFTFGDGQMVIVDDTWNFQRSEWWRRWVFPDNQPDSWTAPINYEKGYTYLRYEIFKFKANAPWKVMLRPCYFQDKHVSEKHSCAPKPDSDYIFTQPGTYYRRFRNDRLTMSSRTDWRRKLLSFMLIDNACGVSARGCNALPTFRIQAVVVADGYPFKPPAGWDCPKEWGCGSSSGGEVVAAPIVTPNGGSFDGSVKVSLSTSTTGALIRYTTDGTEPRSTSPVYAGPFTLSSSGQVRAQAFKTGMTSSAVALATFSIATNAPPQAKISASVVRGLVGEPLSFDGGASSDPDGGLQGFAWTFGDGQTGSGPQVSHTWDAPGTYAVRLTVTDKAGLEAFAVVQVTIVEVDNTPPAITAALLGIGGIVDDRSVSRVLLGGAATPVDSSGVFRGQALLPGGPSEVTVSATDKVGNTAVRLLSVVP